LSKNPFFGSKGSGLSRAERRGKAKAIIGDTELDTDAEGLRIGDDPFGDHNGDHGAEALTEADVDNFFEIERTSSIVELENRLVRISSKIVDSILTNDVKPKDKPFSKFRPSKDRKQAKKKASSNTVNEDAGAEEPIKGQLGGGADIVQRPRDAFPNSGHQFVEEV
jgi:hypothetical protein